MSQVILNGRPYQVDAFVFDKDGLLFQTKPFWQALALARAEELSARLDEDFVEDWLGLMGVFSSVTDDGRLAVEGVDVNGMLAVASPDEEITATAALLAYYLEFPWVEARQAVREVYAAADEKIEKNLKQALKPQRGFPEIFRRLRAAGIPYGIATSDTRERAVRSVDMFDRAEDLAFIITPKEVRRGKPDPEMLCQASEIMNIPVSRLAMVGDSTVDMEMARAAGATGIGVPEHEYVRQGMGAAEIIDSLDEIVIAP